MSALAFSRPPGSLPGAAPSAGASLPAALPAGGASGMASAWVTRLAEPIHTVAWQPDDQAVLALTTTGRLVQLRAADGEPGWGHDTPGHGAVCLSSCPCGAVAATGHLDGTLCLRQAATGKVLHTILLGPAWVEHVHWSPDGQFLAAGSGRVLHLLDGTGRRLGTYPHAAPLQGLHWHPAGRGLAVVSGGALYHWNLTETGLQSGLVQEGTGPVAAVAWSPGCDLLATGLPRGRLGGWRLPAGRPLIERRRTGDPAPVTVLSWRSDGGQLATAHGGDVAIWTVAATGPQARPLVLPGQHAPVRHLAFQPLGPLLAAADAGGTLALWQPTPPASSSGPEPPETHALGSAATALRWTAHGRSLAVGTAAGQVLVFGQQP